jgi:hypothetical protein
MDIYRTANQFLEMWFQHLDSWVLYIARMKPDVRIEFVKITRSTMMHFIDKLDNIDYEALDEFATDTSNIWDVNSVF